ncbi:MAG: hypothetical protein U1E54_01425 [Candidatus Levybacteria bacterium]|nr:hypothetical protein [Candidatus Levybacteria bacterium]
MDVEKQGTGKQIRFVVSSMISKRIYFEQFTAVDEFGNEYIGFIARKEALS